MQWQARMERRLLATLLRLPAGLKRRLAARLEPADGSGLDEDLRLLLALSRTRKPLEARPVAGARRFYDHLFNVLDVDSPPLARKRDQHLALPGRRLRLREYCASDCNSTGPSVLFLHGGGHTVGSVDTYDRLCSFLARQLDLRLLSLDYRLAPEYPWPAAAEDALDVWHWLHRNADTLGLDPRRLGVMGDSAGGNLAAVVSTQAAKRDLPVPAAQCLIYPALDLRMNHPSVERYAQGAGLTRDLLDWFIGNYLPDRSCAADTLASPLGEGSLNNQPPTVLAVCRDPLRDEALVYGHRLRDAGVRLETLDFPDLVHGFAGMAGLVSAAREALLEICEAFGRMLPSPPAQRPPEQRPTDGS